MARVTLYSRPGCRLCVEAMRELRAAVPGIKVDEVDVDSKSSLRNRYGLDIPVAVENGLELFRHRFDPACLTLLSKP